jgi:hypothetical protein
MSSLNEVELLANEIKESKKHHHHHNENRKKYPADYDSSSDYEAKKLGELVKNIDEIKKSQNSENQKHLQNFKNLSESFGN